MCKICLSAAKRLSKACDISVDEAANQLINVTCFPFGTGEDVAKQVDELIQKCKQEKIPKKKRLNYMGEIVWEEMVKTNEGVKNENNLAQQPQKND